MPPFQYDLYRNPYGPSIAQALGHQGDIAAAGALQAGDLQAEAARRNGALQAQMWGTVGNAFTAIPQQMRENRELALKEQQQRQQMQLSTMTLEDRQRQRAAETAFSKALAETPLNEDGTYNVAGIQKAIDPAFGQYAIPQFQHIESVNNALTTQRQKERGESTQALQGIIAAGSNPVFANSWLVTAGARGHISQEDMTTARAQIAEDPSQTEAVLRRFAGPQKPVFEDATKVGYDPLVPGKVVVPGTPKPGEGEYTLGDQRFNAQHQPVGPKATPTLTADERVASLFGREAAGETLNAADKAVLEGWKLKEGSKPFTVKTVDAAGRPVERVMTTAEAMTRGLFASPSTAADADEAVKLSPEGLALTAHQYAMTGQLPPMGMGKQGAATRTAIINKAAEVYQGLDLPTQIAAYKANQSSLVKLQGTVDKVSAFENTAGKNLDQFLTLADKIPDTGVPWLNMPVRMLTKDIVGSDNMAAASAARDVALREIARVTNDPNLSGVLSDSARHEVAALSPQNATLAQIKAVAKVLKQDMANVHGSLTDQIAEIQKRIATPPGGTKTPSSGVRILSITPVP